MSRNQEDDMPEISRESAALQAGIAQALEAHPAVRVPEDFAARLRARLPAAARVRRPRSSALRIGGVAVVVLLAAAFCLAPHSAPRLSSVAFDFELGLIAELAGVTAWLASVRRGA